MKYDEVLTSILVNEKSIIGFLSTIFDFLSRRSGKRGSDLEATKLDAMSDKYRCSHRTDFYCVSDGPLAKTGFPPGVAEKLVITVLKAWDPQNQTQHNCTPENLQAYINNEIMCSMVAQEVEVIADEDEGEEKKELIDEQKNANLHLENNDRPKEIVKTKENEEHQFSPSNDLKDDKNIISEDYTPPVIPVQKNSDTYNGAEREKYSWAQTIMDLDVVVKLPPDAKSSKDIKVVMNSGDICVACKNGDTIIKDKFPFKIKTIDSFWSISEGRLLIHLEKVQERWWNKLLEGEEAIDLSKIDCSRPLDELPEDHIDKVRELQWNQEQKRRGLPTSDEIRNVELLKKAWNAPGSPFQGRDFDPSVLNQSSKDFTSFGSTE